MHAAAMTAASGDPISLSLSRVACDSLQIPATGKSMFKTPALTSAHHPETARST